MFVSTLTVVYLIKYRKCLSTLTLHPEIQLSVDKRSQEEVKMKEIKVRGEKKQSRPWIGSSITSKKNNIQTRSKEESTRAVLSLP